MSRKSSDRRRSFLDNTRNNNFLQKSVVGTEFDKEVPVWSYRSCLETECKQWEYLRKSKKAKAKKKIPSIVINQHEVQQNHRDDQAFFIDRPDYINMIKKANNYLQSLLFVKAIADEREEACEAMISKMDEERDILLTKLFQERPCTLCNDGCTEDIHKLSLRQGEYYPPITSHFTVLSI